CAASPCSTSSRLASVTVGNSLFAIALRWQTKRVGFGRTITSASEARVTRLANLVGHVFPTEVGNRFSYESVTEYRSSATTGATAGEPTITSACEYTKRYDAQRFNARLSGSAILLVCDYQITYKQSPDTKTNGKSRHVFVEELGVFLEIDPDAPS